MTRKIHIDDYKSIQITSVRKKIIIHESDVWIEKQKKDYSYVLRTVLLSNKPINYIRLGTYKNEW